MIILIILAYVFFSRFNREPLHSIFSTVRRNPQRFAWLTTNVLQNLYIGSVYTQITQKNSTKGRKNRIIDSHILFYLFIIFFGSTVNYLPAIVLYLSNVESARIGIALQFSILLCQLWTHESITSIASQHVPSVCFGITLIN